MSEPRKNHLSIDGGQVKEDENVATYKAIPDADSDFKTKPTLSKSKEKISDEAEEKLLDKEEEARIVTRVDMADAKFVVGDHRNGDAKIELDANKKQFTGLTREELLKYADDPFWVRLRWTMFVLFWALWLAMLAGAIAIIVRAPKCAPPPPKTWFQRGPLVDATSLRLEDIEQELPLLQNAKMTGVFVDVGIAYDVLDDPSVLERFKQLVKKASALDIKVIVDLVPNFVTASHHWFVQSLNGSEPYDKYFYWAKGGDFIDGNERSPPNNWVSTLNTSAWSWSEEREEFYLHQHGANRPDLNFHNPLVVAEFDKVVKTYMDAGAGGIRLQKVRTAIVNQSFPDEEPAVGQGSTPGADHSMYAYYRHRYSRDQPQLDQLLAHWAAVVSGSGGGNLPEDSVFTIAEESSPELFLLSRNLTSLRPRATSPLFLHGADVAELAADIRKRVDHWPVMQLKLYPSDEAEEAELAVLAMLLPASPVLSLGQIEAHEGNDTTPSEKLSHLVPLRDDASIKHGDYVISVVPANNSSLQLLAIARWKPDHTGYVGVFNPHPEEARAELRLRSVPEALTVHHISHQVHLYTNYTSNQLVARNNVLVPPKSTVVLSYVPLHPKEE